MNGFKVIDGEKTSPHLDRRNNGIASHAADKNDRTPLENQLPQEFHHAVNTLQEAELRPELTLKEIPAVTQLAPFSIAISAEVPGTAATAASTLYSASRENEELATGRFILLYNPEHDESWGGKFRVVTYIRAALEPDIGHDVMAGSLVWNWLKEALLQHRTRFTNVGGTATRVLSEGFGTLENETHRNNIELRASWTPLSSHMQEHLQAWADMVCSFAGLPPKQESIPHIKKFKLHYEAN